MTLAAYVPKDFDPLDIPTIHHWKNIVNEFRKCLENRINDSRSMGEEILKSNLEIHDALYKLKLYDHDERINEDIRRFARHYYAQLAHQGREKLSEMLTFESTIDKTPKDTKKNNKNNKKNKKKKNKSKKNKQKQAKREEEKKQEAKDLELDEPFDNLDFDFTNENQLGKEFLDEIDNSIQK